MDTFENAEMDRHVQQLLGFAYVASRGAWLPQSRKNRLPAGIACFLRGVGMITNDRTQDRHGFA